MDLTVLNTRLGARPTFLSVRSGGHRKICAARPEQRLSYSFSDALQMKVEILEQVGSCQWVVDRANPQVRVQTEDGGEVMLVASFPQPAQKLEKTVSLPALGPEPRTPAKTAKRKEYMQSYGVDAMFQESIRALLAERPEEPRDFLARHWAPELAQERDAARRDVEYWVAHCRSECAQLASEKAALQEALAELEEANQDVPEMLRRCKGAQHDVTEQKAANLDLERRVAALEQANARLKSEKEREARLAGMRQEVVGMRDATAQKLDEEEFQLHA